MKEIKHHPGRVSVSHSLLESQEGGCVGPSVSLVDVLHSQPLPPRPGLFPAAAAAAADGRAARLKSQGIKIIGRTAPSHIKRFRLQKADAWLRQRKESSVLW